jgi:hypothetical protein
MKHGPGTSERTKAGLSAGYELQAIVLARFLSMRHLIAVPGRSRRDLQRRQMPQCVDRFPRDFLRLHGSVGALDEASAQRRHGGRPLITHV